MLVQPPDSLNTKNTRCTWCVAFIECTDLTNYKLQWHWLGFWRGSKEQFLTFHPHSEPGWLLHSWGCAATSSLEQVTSSLPLRATASKFASVWLTLHRALTAQFSLQKQCSCWATALKISKTGAQIILRNMRLSEECGLHCWKWRSSILKFSLCK